ncbi:ubiquitin-like modifier 1 [Boletus coccyginus]|nr:ubiquitin-like modifier 1 [Boletus coccyginus]
MSTIDLKIEFSGGLELLFDNQRTHSLTLPAVVPSDESATALVHGENEGRATSPDVTYLIRHLRTHLLRERPELFVDGDTVRPGILVLINDTDWELEGEGAYELKSGDEIVFISTLHGG